ncbi:hypothetical protein ACFCWG_18440 [Streptomyces sp. NPDC056390]|uniref:hypothetical protein n=1 Tax=Streptomyces sp. NPDC056390 TaxID=3345806 RepID=UPI0035E2E0C9
MGRRVETWLRREHKAPGITAGQRLWPAFDSVRSVLPCDDALGMVGTLLFHQRCEVHGVLGHTKGLGWMPSERPPARPAEIRVGRRFGGVVAQRRLPHV